uniref:origin recognition complex subunit 4-like n=1 Tax=Styela clava TaxID=7725 RepID=UPI00193AB1F0|nr:origin recognition complex subunit 4-like [Styela clava]
MSLLSSAHDLIRKRMAGLSTPQNIRKDMNQYFLNIEQLLKRTVELGESNSLLIIGPSGSGKTTLLKKSLTNIKKDVNIGKNLMEVHLNGLIQTDDRIALEEITRLLHLENTVGDRVFGSFSENLAFLLEALRTGKSSTSCPILFVLDNFELFAMHKNQTLLYNLFDITQAGTTPMAVIGLTCRLDVMDLLEKRVKSRFSHRQIYIHNGSNFDQYVATFKDLLTLNADDIKTFAGNKNEKNKFLKQWNNFVEKITSDSSVLRSLQFQFDICKEVSSLYTALALVLFKLDPFAKPSDTAGEIVDAINTLHCDFKANVLHGLSVLELCLVIAMHHLNNIYAEPFNFQMVYNEYIKFAKRRSHILQNYSKQVVMKAYEHLIELELIKPMDSSATGVHAGVGSKLQKEYRPMSLLIEQSQLHEAINKYNGCPTDLRQWAMSSLE